MTFTEYTEWYRLEPVRTLPDPYRRNLLGDLLGALIVMQKGMPETASLFIEGLNSRVCELEDTVDVYSIFGIDR